LRLAPTRNCATRSAPSITSGAAVNLYDTFYRRRTIVVRTLDHVYRTGEK
jgi:hypothetical protein